MACGRPIVASAVGGTLELLSDGENGFLIPPNHADALAQKLIQLLEDEALRTRLGASAAQTVHAEFTTQKETRDWMEAYEYVLNPSP